MLKVAKSDRNVVTCGQYLRKVRVQQFHGQDKFQIWIFWVFLNLYGSRIIQSKEFVNLAFSGFQGQKFLIFGVTKFKTSLHKVGNNL